METFKFKTNINCSSCVANVTAALNKKIGEGSWKVNTQDAGKILIVEAKNIDAEEIIEVVREAGYKAEPIS